MAWTDKMKRVVPLMLVVVAVGMGPGRMALAASSAASSSSAPEGRAEVPGSDLARRRMVAEGHLKFLYAMYFAVKGCTEAAREFSKPDFLPPVSLDEVRRLTATADAAAREVGVDVDRAWIVASPIGQATGEALKKDTPENLKKCRQTGTFVRSVLAQLQLSLTGLGSKRSIIEKDF